MPTMEFLKGAFPHMGETIEFTFNQVLEGKVEIIDTQTEISSGEVYNIKSFEDDVDYFGWEKGGWHTYYRALNHELQSQSDLNQRIRASTILATLQATAREEGNYFHPLILGDSPANTIHVLMDLPIPFDIEEALQVSDMTETLTYGFAYNGTLRSTTYP